MLNSAVATLDKEKSTPWATAQFNKFSSQCQPRWFYTEQWLEFSLPFLSLHLFPFIVLYFCSTHFPLPIFSPPLLSVHILIILVHPTLSIILSPATINVSRIYQMSCCIKSLSKRCIPIGKFGGMKFVNMFLNLLLLFDKCYSYLCSLGNAKPRQHLNRCKCR